MKKILFILIASSSFLIFGCGSKEIPRKSPCACYDIVIEEVS